MKRLWQIFVLWVFWVLILWLMASCLDWKPESEPQEKLTHLVPWRCNCLWFKFRKCGCPPGTVNYSLCHHTVKEQNWFDACYEKTMGYLMGATESVSPNAVLWWLGVNSVSELGQVWEKLFKVIPRPSARHSDLYCGTCTLAGNLKTLQASRLGNNITQHATVFRMHQAPVQGVRMVGNQTTGRFMCRRNAGAQGSWRQLLLLLLKLSGLAWTSDALSEEILEDDQFPNGMEDSKDQAHTLGFLAFSKHTSCPVPSHPLLPLPGVPFSWLPGESSLFLQYEEEQLADALFSGILGHSVCSESVFLGEGIFVWFGTDRFMKWSHYWDDKYWFTSNKHSFKREQQVISKLQCEGKVVIYS